MRQILVLFLASASSAELGALAALGDEDGNCCCKKGPCKETHTGDRNWFQHQFEETYGFDAGSNQGMWCCKKLDTQCGGTWLSWSGYKTPALMVAQQHDVDLALCTFGTEGGLTGVSCPAHASYNSNGDCVCDEGYKPENTFHHQGELQYDWSTSTWQGHCVKVECPSHAINHPLCGCPEGFSGKVVWRGAVGERYYDGGCRETACPANAKQRRTGRGLECSCKNGFKSRTGITWMEPSGGGRKAWQGTCDPVRCPTSIFNNDLQTSFPQETIWGTRCACATNTLVFHKNRHTRAKHLDWDDRMKRHIGTCEPKACGAGMHRKRPLDDCVCKDGYYTPRGFNPPRFTEMGWQGYCVKGFPDERQNRTRTQHPPRSQTRHQETRPGPEPAAGARGPQPSGRQTRTEREAPFQAHNTHFREDPKPKKPDPTPKAHRSCGGGFFDFFTNFFCNDDPADPEDEDTKPAPQAPPPQAEKPNMNYKEKPEMHFRPGPNMNARREPAPRAAPARAEPPKPVEPAPTLPQQASRAPPGANRVRQKNNAVCNQCKAVYQWLPPFGTKAIDESTTKQRLKVNYRKGALIIHPDKLVGDPHAGVKGEWFKTLHACYNDMKTEFGRQTDFVDCCGLNPVFECTL